MGAMRAPLPERTYSLAEFEHMPEFDDRYELINGKLVKKPLVDIKHGRITRAIMKAYFQFDPDDAIGEMVGGDVNVRVADDYAPAPDISFWKSEHRPANVSGAAPLPDLVVEIWSPGDLASRTRREEARAKITRYLEAGVQLVWAVNPKSQTVEVYRQGQPEPEVLDIAGQLDGEDVIPGFKAPVGRIFG